VSRQLVASRVVLSSLEWVNPVASSDAMWEVQEVAGLVSNLSASILLCYVPHFVGYVTRGTCRWI
jgi:hypothetical protein